MTPIKWKRDLILWLLNRAKFIASTDTIYKQEIINLKEKFIKNGYPKKFVDDVTERSINNNRECTNKKLNNTNFKNILKEPYIGKPGSECKKKLEKLLNSYIEDFKNIFTISKVGNYFSKKNKTSHELKSYVVYEYKCTKDKEHPIYWIYFKTTNKKSQRIFKR